LLWLLVLVVLLIILSQLFGGFQRGTKVGSLGVSVVAGASLGAVGSAPASVSMIR
jgi:hypothetical protein